MKEICVVDFSIVRHCMFCWSVGERTTSWISRQREKTLLDRATTPALPPSHEKKGNKYAPM